MIMSDLSVIMTALNAPSVMMTETVTMMEMMIAMTTGTMIEMTTDETVMTVMMIETTGTTEMEMMTIKPSL